MPDGIKVNWAALEQCKADIDGSVGKLRAQMDQLKGDIQPLLANWGGEGREAYHQKQQQWDRAAEDLFQVLSKVGAAVGDVLNNYQQGEKQAVNRMS